MSFFASKLDMRLEVIFSKAVAFLGNCHKAWRTMSKKQVTTGFPNVPRNNSNNRFNESRATRVCEPVTIRETTKKCNALFNKSYNMRPDTLGLATSEEQVFNTLKLKTTKGTQAMRAKVDKVQMLTG